MVEHDTVNVEVGGSSPLLAAINDSVVQWLETLGCRPRGRWFKSGQSRQSQIWVLANRFYIIGCKQEIKFSETLIAAGRDFLFLSKEESRVNR